MSPANNSGSRPSSRGGSSMQGRSSDRRNSPSKSSSRPSSSRPSSSTSRPGSSRPGSSRPSGSYRDGASSGGRTASGRDSSDRSSYSGRSTEGRSSDRRNGSSNTSRGDSSRPSSRPSSDRGERSTQGRSSDRRDARTPTGRSDERRSFGSRDSRPSSDRPSRSYGDRPERRDDRRPSSDRPAGRTYGDRDSRPSSDRSDRPAGRSYGDRDSRPSSRPTSDRPRRSTEGRSTDRRDERDYGSRDSRTSTDKPRRSNPYGGDRPRASDDRDSRPSSRYSERGGRPDRAGGRFADDREERPRGRVGEKRVNVQDPIIPDHITGEELPRAVRNELRTLPEGLALRVARHLAASVEAATVNPEISWQHAKAALSKASRVGIIREAAAEAAYNAGHYAEALIEFRAARRMRGIKEYWPLMADCERACGRPMKAIEMAGDPLVKNLDHASRVEMRIVAAGARMDMGNLDAALATLQCPDLTVTSVEPWSARIRYAYADVLEQMGRTEEALEWFHRAAAVDADMLTDADKRVRKLEGKSSDSDNDDEYGYEDLEDFDYSGEFGDQEDSGDNDEAIKE